MEISIDSAPCYVFAFGDDGKITQANHTACEGLGYQTGELMEHNIEMVLTLASRIFFQTHLFPMVKLQHKAEEIFIELQSKSGQIIPVLVNAKREMRGMPLNVMVAIVVHNRQKYEMELIAAKKKVEEALQTPNLYGTIAPVSTIVFPCTRFSSNLAVSAIVSVPCVMTIRLSGASTQCLAICSRSLSCMLRLSIMKSVCNATCVRLRPRLSISWTWVSLK